MIAVTVDTQSQGRVCLRVTSMDGAKLGYKLEDGLDAGAESGVPSQLTLCLRADMPQAQCSECCGKGISPGSEGQDQEWHTHPANVCSNRPGRYC